MCLFFVTVFSACTKLDTTIIGADLIPAVDNIHTFADTLDLEASQHYLPDSLTKVAYNGKLALGKINNDPLFGKTEANVYLQLKPTFYPYYFGNAGDSIVRIDSVVLCLAYSGSWGDTTQSQTFEVSEVNDPYFRDSVTKFHNVAYQPQTGQVFTTKEVSAQSLKNYFYYRNRDSVNNQIRIKIASADLNPQFLEALKSRDTSATDFTSNSFRNDSLFRRFNQGFAIKAIGTNSNSLMYVSATDTKTKLEVHYVSKRNNVLDTAFSNFYFQGSSYSSIAPSSVANYVQRDSTGFPAANPGPDEFYLQTAPGNYVEINPLGLDTLSNRIVHRAYLEITQVPDNVFSDSAFSVPHRMYLDLKDTTAAPAWRPVPYDLTNAEYYDPNDAQYFYPTNGINFSYFGGYPRQKPLATGGNTKYYFFNLTRYVQKVVMNERPANKFRLFAPHSLIYPQFNNSYIPFDNPVAYGRIRIGSPQNPNPQFKMRFIIVYSNL